MPQIYEEYYWNRCSVEGPVLLAKNWSCKSEFFHLNPFVTYVSRLSQYNNDNASLPKQLYRSSSIFPINESMETFKMSVGRNKVALAGYNSEMNEIMSELRTIFKGVRFFRGKDNLWPHNKYWLFRKFNYNQPKTELVQLMASGIYHFWKYWLRDRKFSVSKLKEKHTALPHPLSLGSNLAFVFIIYVLGLAVSSTALLVENLFIVMHKHAILRRITVVLCKILSINILEKCLKLRVY